MNRILTFFLLLTSITAFGQQDLSSVTAPLVAEGKALYRSEMASWFGTDIFLAQYNNRENVGGYFSYTENGISKCIFFSRTAQPTVIGTISFDSTYNVKTAGLDLDPREFTPVEKTLYTIRKITLEEISKNGIFKSYQNTNFNLIPIIYNNQKKVYVLTGPQESELVLFGNDYLLEFDRDNKLISKKQLHQNLIPVTFGKKAAVKNVVGTVHSHLPESGDLITVTDICTLLLYEKYTGWQQHQIISEKYLSIWNCMTDELTVLPAPEDLKKSRKRKN